jgi:hypothetical protein
VPKDLGCENKSDEEGQRAEGAEEVHWFLSKPADERDGQKVEKPVYKSFDSKFRSPVLSFLVHNRLFRNAGESGPLRDQWNVAMHFSVNVDISHHSAVVGFESAIEVMQLDAGEFAGNVVEELRWQCLGEGVMPFFFSSLIPGGIPFP